MRPFFIKSTATKEEFQSTHSLRSATFAFPLANILCESFNPRTPCGVRQVFVAVQAGDGGFNPRTPCGVRQFDPNQAPDATQFQSTHSLRSATAGQWSRTNYFLVSIHALLAECDLRRRGGRHQHGSFNPRTPCGVRLRLTIYIVIQQRKRYFAPTSRRRPSSPSLLF